MIAFKKHKDTSDVKVGDLYILHKNHSKEKIFEDQLHRTKTACNDLRVFRIARIYDSIRLVNLDIFKNFNFDNHMEIEKIGLFSIEQHEMNPKRFFLLEHLKNPNICTWVKEDCILLESAIKYND